MADTTSDAVHVSREGDVCVIRLDDGKVNALSHALINAVDAALDDAVGDGCRSVALLGREGKFSAGFDLSVMQAGPEAARDMLAAGAKMGHHLYTLPVPVVIGCTGHALAMGAILLFCADARIGAEGPFKIGMNEVAIGMPVPRFAVELARDRLTPAWFQHATLLAQIFDPATAVEAGYLDRLVPVADLDAAVLEEAARLGASLNPGAFRATRDTVRSALAQRLMGLLEQDVATFLVAP